MLGPGRYLLGAVELIWLVGFAWIGAAQVRRRLLPQLTGEAGHLATTVVALALLIWVAELLGTVSAFKPVPYLLSMAVVGSVLRLVVPPAGGAPMGPPCREQAAEQPSTVGEIGVTGPAAGARPSLISTVIALVIAGIAIGHFVTGVKLRLGTGMTGFDSTWYHGPFAAGFFQSGNTFDLHFIAPQFLAWFYPANSEVLHAVGMLAFSRDLMSPLLNLGWLVGCLFACWCIGRPFGVAPWSLALGAIALSVPALADQAGEARNDIVGIFFLLSAVAIAVNVAGGLRSKGLPTGALLTVGLAGGLAAGTKLNFLLPATVLVFGLVAVAPNGRRWWTLLCAGGMALAGGGYWYLRNLVHTGNPLPWFKHLGPIDLPAPGQGLGGRETHTVLSYLTDGTVWSEWFFPGLHGALWIIWPLLGFAALAGLLLAVAQRRRRSGVLMIAGLVGLAAAVSWLVSPTSASGPEGMPRGFESGLRYLSPALILGLALLPTMPPLRAWAARVAALGPKLGDRPVPPDERPHSPPGSGGKRGHGVEEDRLPRRWVAGILVGATILALLVGYPVQRHYLQSRYRDPSFTTPGLDAAFAWARDVSGARIGTTSTRQYPLFGTDLSNHVAYIGLPRPHGGFEEPQGCRQFIRLVNEGDYDYVVASRDRIEPGKPAYPPSATWVQGPNAEVVLKKKPTVVFRITGPLDPSRCAS